MTYYKDKTMTEFNEDDFAKTIVPKEMGNSRLNAEAFIKAFNAGEAELVDIRVPMEIAVWQVNFGMKIPANELPKDKTLVLACPMSDRSNMARSYLLSKGYDAKYLQGGLLGLMDHLKGGMAKQIEIR
jgi:rhodanese-related sulfurtransferase